MIEVSPSEYDNRVSKTRARMKQAGVDALFIYSDEYHPGYSMYYTNFRTINCVEESAHALFLPLEGEIHAFVGNLNRFAARRFSWVKNAHSIYEMRRVLPALVQGLPYPIRKIGIVGEELFPIYHFREMEQSLLGIALVEASEIVKMERLRKSPNELAVIREAGKLADDSIRAALEQVAVGKTEVELSAIGNTLPARAGEISGPRILSCRDRIQICRRGALRIGRLSVAITYGSISTLLCWATALIPV